MDRVERVSIVLDLHPEDYRRFQEAASRADMNEGEFGGLALHKGIGLLRDIRMPLFSDGALGALEQGTPDDR